MVTEFEKARDDYRKHREDGTAVDLIIASRRYIAQLEQKVAELESHLRNRTSRGSW